MYIVTGHGFLPSIAKDSIQQLMLLDLYTGIPSAETIRQVPFGTASPIKRDTSRSWYPPPHSSENTFRVLQVPSSVLASDGSSGIRSRRSFRSLLMVSWVKLPSVSTLFNSLHPLPSITCSEGRASPLVTVRRFIAALVIDSHIYIPRPLACKTCGSGFISFDR